MVMLNLTASFQLIRTFGPAMAGRGSGSIVGFSSIRVLTIEPGQGDYAATKAGLEMPVRTAAAEYCPSGVRVNAIRPGVVETPLTRQLRDNRDWYDAYARRVALGRWARARKLAARWCAWRVTRARSSPVPSSRSTAVGPRRTAATTRPSADDLSNSRRPVSA